MRAWLTDTILVAQLSGDLDVSLQHCSLMAHHCSTFQSSSRIAKESLIRTQFCSVSCVKRLATWSKA
jgi:hypothetical protein